MPKIAKMSESGVVEPSCSHCEGPLGPEPCQVGSIAQLCTSCAKKGGLEFDLLAVHVPGLDEAVNCLLDYGGNDVIMWSGLMGRVQCEFDLIRLGVWGLGQSPRLENASERMTAASIRWQFEVVRPLMLSAVEVEAPPSVELISDVLTEMNAAVADALRAWEKEPKWRRGLAQLRQQRA